MSETHHGLASRGGWNRGEGPVGNPLAGDRVVRACLIILTVITSVGVMRFMQPALAPMLIAVPLACLIWPIHRWLAARLGNGGSITAMIFLLLLILICGGTLAYHKRDTLSQYARGAIVEVGRSAQKIFTGIAQWAEHNEVPIDQVLPEPLKPADNPPPETPLIDLSRLTGGSDTTQNQNNQPRIGRSESEDGSNEIRSVAAIAMVIRDRFPFGFGSLLTQVIGVGLAMVLCGYLLIESTRRRGAPVLPVDPAYRDKVFDELATLSGEVRRYFRACLVVGCVTGAMTALLTWALGMPFPLAWGLMVCVGEFIPTLGTLASVSVTALVGLTTLDTQPLIILLVGLAVIQSLEGALLQPLLFGRALKVPPLIALLSLIFWGWLLGIAGAFMAVPLTLMGLRIARFLLTHGLPKSKVNPAPVLVCDDQPVPGHDALQPAAR